jgi:hypothetical protein
MIQQMCDQFHFTVSSLEDPGTRPVQPEEDAGKKKGRKESGTGGGGGRSR